MALTAEDLINGAILKFTPKTPLKKVKKRKKVLKVKLAFSPERPKRKKERRRSSSEFSLEEQLAVSQCVTPPPFPDLPYIPDGLGIEEIPVIKKDRETTSISDSFVDAIGIDEEPENVGLLSQTKLCSYYGPLPKLKKKRFPATRKALKFIQANDFELPPLNLLKWEKWPANKPSETEAKRIKAEFPHFSRKSLTQQEMEVVNSRVEDLLQNIGLKSNQLDVLLNEIRCLSQPYNSTMKAIVAGFIGQPLLATRLAIKIWKSLTAMCSNEPQSVLNPNEESMEDVTASLCFMVKPTFAQDSNHDSSSQKTQAPAAIDKVPRSLSPIVLLKKISLPPSVMSESMNENVGLDSLDESFDNVPEVFDENRKIDDRKESSNTTPNRSRKAKAVTISPSKKKKKNSKSQEVADKPNLPSPKPEKKPKKSPSKSRRSRDIERKSKMLSEFFFDKPFDGLGTLAKIVDFVKENDFELPPLNCEISWAKWPGMLPTMREYLELEKRYPYLKRCPLNDDEEDKMEKRLAKIVKAVGYSYDSKGVHEFMDVLIQCPQKYQRVKLLVSGYLAGRRMLEKRLVIDVWRRLLRLVEKISETQISKKKFLALTEEAIENNAPIISKEIRNKLNLKHSEVRNSTIVNTGRQKGRQKRTKKWGAYSYTEDEIIMIRVFNQLNIKSISEYTRGGLQRVRWVDIAAELGRNLDYCHRRWNYIYLILKRYDETEVVAENFDELYIDAIDLILSEQPHVKCKDDVDTSSIRKKVKYLTNAKIHDMMRWAVEKYKDMEMPFIKALAYHRHELASRKPKKCKSARRMKSLIDCYRDIRDDRKIEAEMEVLFDTESESENEVES